MSQAIQSLPIFMDATDDEMAWLIANSTEVTVPRGEFFFREGEPARQFYVVIEGELQVTRTLNGETFVMGTTPRGIIGGQRQREALGVGGQHLPDLQQALQAMVAFGQVGGCSFFSVSSRVNRSRRRTLEA